MYEQVELTERFQTLLAQERQAEREYGELAAATEEPALREQIEQLRREKQRHVDLTQRLLEIME